MKNLALLTVSGLLLFLTIRADLSPTQPVLRVLNTRPTNANDIAIVMDWPTEPHTSLIYGAIAGPRFGMEFPTVTGSTYRVYYTTDIWSTNTDWCVAPATYVGDGHPVQFYDRLTSPARYYRVKVE